MGVMLRTQHFPLKTKGQMSHCLPGKTRCYLEPIHWAHAWFEQLSLFKIHGRGEGEGGPGTALRTSPVFVKFFFILPWLIFIWKLEAVKGKEAACLHS